MNKVVYTYGVYDLFHTGHLKLLQKAKELGDFLIVGVVKDEAVKALKGKNRPVIDTVSRCKLVESCKCVDRVIIQPEFKCISSLDDLRHTGVRVKVLALGEDQTHLGVLDFAYLKEGHNIDIIRLPRSWEVSTSDIIKKIKDEK